MSSTLLEGLIALLWLLWFLFLFGGFLFGTRHDEGRRRIPRWSRLASSLMLVLAAWLLALLAEGSPTALFGVFVAAGMSLGLLGDLFMARFFSPRRSIFGGIAAFALGHIAYISAILRLESQLSPGSGDARPAVWLGWLLFGLVGWYITVYRGEGSTAIRWAALPYTLLLASTAGAASALALQLSSLWPLALGAILFLLSDLILAAELFRGLRYPLIGDSIWLTYGPGQMLIVFSILTVHRLPVT